MKIREQRAESAISYGGLIEKIEILRSTLRWASKLERPQIQKLLGQCNALREEVLQLSHKERFVTASARGTGTRNQNTAQRRKALLDRSFVFEGVFGESPKLLDALEIAEKAAPTDLPVLIDGESGTGKELMAKVIHANGSRADKPYISVNCGAIPDNLIESELFGHKRGAFTGATSDRSGKFEAANSGTIFLDEIGELPLPGQVKLLRVLQSNEIQRVGSDNAIEIDTRIVAATNKNLLKMCREGAFREDLYYRLGVIQVTLPPLRERKDEIPLLIEYFSDEAAERLRRRPVRLSRALRTFLLNFAYPGNIRELRNIIFRISCLASDTADIEHLPEPIRPDMPEYRPQGDGQAQSQQASLADVKKAASDAAERVFLERGLREQGGRVSELARRLDMNRSHLQTLLKKHGLHSKDYRAKG
jgi:transcriptional regulator with GAF, ATPase, and Fis domain